MRSTYTVTDWMLGLGAFMAVGVVCVMLVALVLPKLLPDGFPTGPVAAAMSPLTVAFIVWTRMRGGKR
jgi:hypothetical protein